MAKQEVKYVSEWMDDFTLCSKHQEARKLENKAKFSLEQNKLTFLYLSLHKCIVSISTDAGFHTLSDIDPLQQLLMIITSVISINNDVKSVCTEEACSL